MNYELTLFMKHIKTENVVKPTFPISKPAIDQSEVWINDVILFRILYSYHWGFNLLEVFSRYVFVYKLTWKKGDIISEILL